MPSQGRNPRVARLCQICQKPAIYQCSSCKTQQYCSVECQTGDWKNHRAHCANINAGQRNQPTTEQPQAPHEETEEDIYAATKFYIKELYTILKPVLLCILTSLMWVKLSHPPNPFFDTGVPIFVPSFKSSFGSTGTQDDTNSLIIAGIIMGQIVLSTIVMACLMHYGKVKIIIGILGVTMVMILGYLGFQLITSLFSIFNIPIDYITLFFCLWNFTMVGLSSVFYDGPVLLQKIYLVLISSMMAFSLSQLSVLVTWLLLGFLAVWDLIAVLCPFGPLKLMIESAERNGTEIPSALIYSAMVWFMASPGSLGPSTQSPNLANDPDTLLIRERVTSDSPLIVHNNIEMNHLDQSPVQLISEPEKEERNGLKLGLGDFVFYSVLVGRASLYDWIVTIGTILAVISGLVSTIFILILARKPLPALPISIFFGIVIFLVGSLTLSPMIESLIVITGKDEILRAGASRATFIYL